MLEVINSYPNNKSAGLDNITKEIIRVFVNSKLIDHILDLYNLCLHQCETPKRWNISVVHPVPKNKEAK